MRLEQVVLEVLSRVSPSVMCREGDLVEGGDGGSLVNDCFDAAD